MARLNSSTESGDDFPDLADLLRTAKEFSKSAPQRQDGSTASVASQPKTAAQSTRQRPLKIAHVNSLLLPLTSGTLRHAKDARNHDDTEAEAEEQISGPLGQEKEKDCKENRKGKDNRLRSSPRKAVKVPTDYSTFDSVQEKELDLGDESSSEDHLSDFIVDDSASDLEAPPVRSPEKDPKRFQKSNSSTQPASRSHKPSSIIDLTSPEKPIKGIARPQAPPRGPFEDRFDEKDFGHLQFSPPRSRTPHRHSPGDRPRTPPSSPPKPKLQSPTKHLHRIPPSPHRPSIDAFWSQEVINDWNDQYSPQKLKSPRKLFSVREDDEADLSPSTSPKKSPLKSPGKKDKAAIERRKAFDEKKHQLATSFFQELDLKVAEGRVASMAESAGGIKIVWSKKLNSTAGRANWKREALRTQNADGTFTTTYRHHASIELAEKVIDDEERLHNVLAHEYCHLANFMISNIKNNPHGKEFKAWAAKTTELFEHLGIKVTTTHTYAITYKYIWACMNGDCGLEFKRHSKSIDPKRHSCGACKGKLVQVQPAPRKGKGEGEGDEGDGLTEYQRFVKANFGRVKGETSGSGVGEVMKRVGEEFRKIKAQGRVEEALGGGTEKREGSEEAVFVVDDGEEVQDERGPDDVVRKLDFLSLG